MINESRVFIKKKEEITRSKLWQLLNNMSKNAETFRKDFDGKDTTRKKLMESLFI